MLGNQSADATVCQGSLPTLFVFEKSLITVGKLVCVSSCSVHLVFMAVISHVVASRGLKVEKVAIWPGLLGCSY